MIGAGLVKPPFAHLYPMVTFGIGYPEVEGGVPEKAAERRLQPGRFSEPRFGQAELAGGGQPAAAGREHHACAGGQVSGQGRQAVRDDGPPLTALVKPIEEQHGLTRNGSLLQCPPQRRPLIFRNAVGGGLDQHGQRDVRPAQRITPG